MIRNKKSNGIISRLSVSGIKNTIKNNAPEDLGALFIYYQLVCFFL